MAKRKIKKAKSKKTDSEDEKTEDKGCDEQKKEIIRGWRSGAHFFIMSFTSLSDYFI